jgi:7,8-dihydropterin-6-yl-methyl-4-(beta-D-ribofuranosyl)aminobenzene 5'-phosphate synthase
MINKLTVTILVDNRSHNSSLLSEHGLALWIEMDDHKILFDTGRSDMVLYNAGLLGIDLSTAESLVISHGHYDHSGGIADIIKINPSINIYCHPGIFLSRYSRQPDGAMKSIGISDNVSDSLHRIESSIKWVSKPLVKFGGDFGITGSIPRRTDFENTGGDFFLDQQGDIPDPIEDDMSIWFRTAKGLVIITGCCHSGIINTINRIFEISGERNLHAVIGGFHLKNASSQSLECTFNALQSISSCKFIACHCTGENSVRYLQSKTDLSVVNGGAGMVFEVI